jgi:integrase
VEAWRDHLHREQALSAATVNNHLDSLSAFATWVYAQVPYIFPRGNPTRGITHLAPPPLEPRALSDEQVRLLKSLCERLPRLHQAQRGGATVDAPLSRAYSRPWRDRALIFVLLSTGLRREDLVKLDLSQVEPPDPTAPPTSCTMSYTSDTIPPITTVKRGDMPVTHRR